jgi:hypothetical protein
MQVRRVEGWREKEERVIAETMPRLRAVRRKLTEEEKKSMPRGDVIEVGGLDEPCRHVFNSARGGYVSRLTLVRGGDAAAKAVIAAMLARRKKEWEQAYYQSRREQLREKNWGRDTLEKLRAHAEAEKRRYHTDPVYREKAKARAKASKAKRRQAAEAKKAASRARLVSF